MGLYEEGKALEPWYLRVQVTPELATDVYQTTEKNKISNSHEGFKKLLRSFYNENEIGTKTFLDCACNCGAFCYWAREVGIKSCYGFDVREHWIKQAQWLQKNMTTGPTDNITFIQCDLYDVPKLDVPKSNVVLFSGLFYHLPYPVQGLKIAADLAEDIIIVNTQTAPNAPIDCMVIRNESVEPLVSGTYGLNFIPAGPELIIKLLRWMGFNRFRTTFHNKFEDGRGRTQVIGFRK